MILITEIRPRRSTKLFEVFSEAGLEFVCNEKFLLQNQLLPHMEYEEEDFETLRAKAQILDGIRKCVDILSRKDYSKKELMQKLSDKQIPEDAAAVAVNYMEEHGYQDDFRYGKRLAELAKNTYGRRRAEQILYQHGIDREMIKEICDQVFEDDSSEWEKLDAILQKAVKDGDLRDPALRNKVFAKLARLGYSSSAIREAFSRYETERKDENL